MPSPRLGPAAGRPPLSQVEEAADESGRMLCALIRQNVSRIGIESSGLSLELRRLLADTRDAIAIATGSAGTYDARGRTDERTAPANPLHDVERHKSR